MLFMNFSGETADSFRSKYGEVAEHYKGEAISFLLGDLDSSQGAFQVSICLFSHPLLLPHYTFGHTNILNVGLS